MKDQEPLLAYPRYSREFVVHADSSNYHMGGVVLQERRPIAFFFHKLTRAQRKYTTMEKKLLGIVETIK